jgi:hypothetical protein
VRDLGIDHEIEEKTAEIAETAEIALVAENAEEQAFLCDLSDLRGFFCT